MRKLSIDSVFRLRKYNPKDVGFYYSYMLNYGRIEYNPKPRLNLIPAIQKISSVNDKAGLFAAKVFGNYPDIDSKSLVHHLEYREKSFRNFIPSRPLLEVLSKIKVDMATKDLKDINAYFELGGFLNCQFALVSVLSISEELRMIKVTLTDKDNALLTQYFGDHLNENTLEESLARMVYKEAVLEDAESWKISHKELSTPDIMRARINLIANLLIYISNPNEDFKEQYNQFSKDNKKAQREKLEYTSRPFTPIGEGIEFLRLIREEEVGVVGHFRWQPCGVGRTQRKLTFVKPHVRTYKKFEGGSVEN